MTDIDFEAEAQTWLRECGYDSTGTNAVTLAAKLREIAERAGQDVFTLGHIAGYRHCIEDSRGKTGEAMRPTIEQLRGWLEMLRSSQEVCAFPWSSQAAALVLKEFDEFEADVSAEVQRADSACAEVDKLRAELAALREGQDKRR